VRIFLFIVLMFLVACNTRRSGVTSVENWLEFQKYSNLVAHQTAPKRLPIPVARVKLSQITDTWGGARGEGRKHEGVDIFAPLGTPIYSATDGIVIVKGKNRLGGNTVTIWGAGDKRYYYAHLSKYANIKQGQIVTRGTLIGFVGVSGNARGTPPHLHFGVYEQNWQAKNPFSMLEEHGSQLNP
jgi:peptidoglycan LD-endopeptidase LytH